MKSLVRKTLVATLGTTLFVVLGIHFLLTAWIQTLEERIKQPLAMQESAAGMQIKKAMQRRKRDLNVYVKQNKTVFDMVLGHVALTNMLPVIGESTADKVWLNQYSMDAASKQLSLTGKSFGTRLVSEFMLELRRLPYFESVELISMGKDGSESSGEIDFQIVCHLK